MFVNLKNKINNFILKIKAKMFDWVFSFKEE